jgi:hypothetical protein
MSVFLNTSRQLRLVLPDSEEFCRSSGLLGFRLFLDLSTVSLRSSRPIVLSL